MAIAALEAMDELGKFQKASTVGARIPNIRIPNPFENRTFSCSVLGCSVFEWYIRKPNFHNGRSKLDRFIYKEKKMCTHKTV